MPHYAVILKKSNLSEEVKTSYSTDVSDVKKISREMPPSNAKQGMYFQIIFAVLLYIANFLLDIPVISESVIFLDCTEDLKKGKFLEEVVGPDRNSQFSKIIPMVLMCYTIFTCISVHTKQIYTLYTVHKLCRKIKGEKFLRGF